MKILLASLALMIPCASVGESAQPVSITMGLGTDSCGTFIKAIITALFVGLVLVLGKIILFYVLPALFTLYLLYGFIRPRISRKVRYELEEEDDEDDPAHAVRPP